MNKYNMVYTKYAKNIKFNQNKKLLKISSNK